MYKVQNQSKDSVDKNPSILKKREPSNYTPTNDEADIIGFIKERYSKMNSKRQVIDQRWQTYQKQYEAMFVPYPDGRSSSNVPLERAIIELFVAEAMKRPTRFRTKATYGNEFQAKVLDKVWKYDWTCNKRENEIIDNEYITAIFGTSVMYTGFELKTRIIEDFEGLDDNNEVKFVRKKQTRGDIILQNFDIRHFWLDERAHSMDEAIDCIAEQYITEEEYYNLRFNKFYKNIDAETATYYFHDDKFTYVSTEERGDGQSLYVKLTHYWNKELDTYVVVANDRVVIREHAIMNATHDLPFVVRQYGRNVFSIYGYGLCEALMTFKSDINNLREMLMDAIKRSNSETIAIGNGLTFDGNSFAYNNQIMKFKGDLGGNFQQLTGTPPNQAIFNYLERIYKDIAMFCGIDIQNILGEPQQTAYQTAVQKESMLQRVNVVLKNRDAAFERLADLHKNNLQMFYPIKLVRELVKIGKDGRELEEKEAKYPEIEIEGEKIEGQKFTKSDGNSVFEVTPENIRGSVKLEVYTDLNAPTINEVEKAQKLDFFGAVANITSAYATNPDLDSIMPMKKTIRDLAESLNIEVESIEDGKVKEEREKLISEVQALMPSMATMPSAPMEQPVQEPVNPLA